MAPPDVESTDIFDFGKVCEDIDLRQRKDEYYQGLLDARDIAEKAIVRTLGDAPIERIRDSLDAQLRHQETTGLSRFVLDAWVRRSHHLRTKILPAAILSGLALVGYTVKGMYDAHKLVVAEQNVERSLQDAVSGYGGMRSELSFLQNDPAITRLPEHEKEAFHRDISGAEDTLERSRHFFERYPTIADIERGVTPLNYSDISAQTAKHVASLGDATSRLNSARGIITHQTKLEEAERRIGGLYSQLRESGCPPDELEPLDRLRVELDTMTANGDLPGLEKVEETLTKMSDQLLSTYELRVVGGIWIFQNRDPSQRSFYLKTQAVDGQPVWLPIQDDDRGGIVTRTPMWGEAVPEAVYQAVGNDKKDNGIIDNAIMGRKARCASSPTYDYRVTLADGSTFTLKESRSRITPVHPDRDLSQERSWRD